VVSDATAVVLMAKDAVDFPAGMTTVVCTTAVRWLLDSETRIPPAGAEPLIATVPVDAVPP
jgi:hypothetical protein